MKRLFTIILLALFFTAYAGAQNLAESELKSVDIGTVEFVNYEGPHERIDSLSQILGIGRNLAAGLAGGTEFQVEGKYRIQRIFDPQAKLLSADIFSLEPDAQVDHIKNLRRIIAAYLADAYGYSFDDASVLAEFVTYYNAVHRGEMDYIRSAYQPAVPAALDPQKAGLATVYSQWPGNTEMLLPISSPALSGGAGSVDTGALTDNSVVQQLQQEEDKGIPQRKDMTELKQQEVEKQQEQIDKAKEDIAAQEQSIAEQQQQIDTAKEQLAQDKQQAAATGDQTAKAAQEEQIASKEADIQSKQAAVDEQKSAVEDKKAEVAKAEAEVQQKTDTIRSERETIAQDERSLIQEKKTEPAKEVPFLYLAKDGSGLRMIVSSDSKTGAIRRQSGINTIRSRDLAILGDSYLVIAGDSGGNRAVRLVTINPDSFEMTAQGDTNMYPESFLLVDGRRVFGVIDNNGYRIGRFDTSLKLQASSQDEVVPDTWITVREGSLYSQGKDGTMLVLDPDNLTSIAE